MRIPLTMSAGTVVIREVMGDDPAAARGIRELEPDDGVLEATVAELLDRYPEAEDLFLAAGIAGQDAGRGALSSVHRLEVRQALELGDISSPLFLRLLQEMVQARSFRLGL